MLEFQNIKTFLLKDMLQIGQKFLVLVKIQFVGLMLLNVVNDLSSEKITGSFYEKELQKTSQ